MRKVKWRSIYLDTEPTEVFEADGVQGEGDLMKLLVSIPPLPLTMSRKT